MYMICLGRRRHPLFSNLQVISMCSWRSICIYLHGRVWNNLVANMLDREETQQLSCSLEGGASQQVLFNNGAASSYGHSQLLWHVLGGI